MNLRTFEGFFFSFLRLWGLLQSVFAALVYIIHTAGQTKRNTLKEAYMCNLHYAFWTMKHANH